MSDCGCHHEAKSAQERRILTIALVLNAAMAVIGGVAGWMGQSTGLLAPLKSGEVHLRATWIFTRADVVANVGVIVAGILVLVLASPYPDYVIGTLIGLYVIKEALEILSDARNARSESKSSK